MIISVNFGGHQMVVELSFRELVLIGAYGGVGLALHRLWEHPGFRG